jgi:hypothetical protein
LPIPTYQLSRKHFDEINNVSWSCFVFDEVHKIKSQNAKLTQQCKKIRTNCRIGSFLIRKLLARASCSRFFDDFSLLLNFNRINRNAHTKFLRGAVDGVGYPFSRVLWKFRKFSKDLR